MLGQIAQILIRTGRSKKLITYGKLSEEINFQFGRYIVHPISVSRYIRQVCYEFYENFGVFPGSVVVSKSTGMPSEGYFSFIENFGFKSSDRKGLWLGLLNQFYRFCEVMDGNTSLPDTLFDSRSPRFSVDTEGKKRK
ncbi:hypothetical protein [Balnearium lithotrophicum]|uniref:hypothetical protein n=1 Tax=Balnearium lithotrophicum TaxID=223788 RepID=UPI00115C7592|nr:hypothetical protein [Balnearium lithotrophicum]